MVREACAISGLQEGRDASAVPAEPWVADGEHVGRYPMEAVRLPVPVNRGAIDAESAELVSVDGAVLLRRECGQRGAAAVTRVVEGGRGLWRGHLL